MPPAVICGNENTVWNEASPVRIRMMLNCRIFESTASASSGRYKFQQIVTGSVSVICVRVREW